MTPETLSIYFETSPAIKLLQSKNAPFLASFLHERFKKTHAIVLSHSELTTALSLFQEKLQEAGHDVLRGQPDDYLRDWSSPEKRWLLRFLEAGRSEPMYQLTSHAEAVLEFLERSSQQEQTFVGTDSRLRFVIQTLEELLVGASADPAVRLKDLRAKQDRISAEIAMIESVGSVTPFAPTRVREQFALAVRMLKQLQGDFRAVEENFKEITRQVRQRQSQGQHSRGSIIGDVLGAEEELKKRDQGVSFFEFLKFIQSPEQQDRLHAVIQQLLQLRELADQSEGLATIRHMVRGLLHEAEQVLQTTRRLSASLRRLLDPRSQHEGRRAQDVLREIREIAAVLCNDPPRHLGIEVEQGIDIAAPMARTNWAPQAKFDQVNLTEYVSDEETRRRVFGEFQLLQPIDWNGMRRRIREAVEPHGQCTLGELLRDEPPGGLVDVLGYLQIACDDRHQVRVDAFEEVLLPDANFGMRAVTVPLVTFVARGPL